MKRRSFLRASLATLGTAAAGAAVEAAGPGGGEVYELRVYSLPAAKQPLLDHYLSQAYIPALKRHGSGPVGAFVEPATSGQEKVYVLAVHPSVEAVVGVPHQLAADADYQKTAAEYLNARAADPVYARIDSSLLTPITGVPKLVRPDTSKPRLLNLRIYENHNERAAAKKVEMFNTGELAIFRRVGLTPVFFASTVVGAAMPNLTYMLVFPDEAGRAAAWNKFRGDAEWNKLRAIPEYADKEIVSRITNKILTPTPYSEI
jgi:NIPSNAP